MWLLIKWLDWSGRSYYVIVFFITSRGIMLLPVKTLSSSSVFRSVSLITVMSLAMCLAMLTSFCCCCCCCCCCCFVCCYSSLLPRVSLLPVPWALGLEDEILLSEAHPLFFYETPWKRAVFWIVLARSRTEHKESFIAWVMQHITANTLCDRHLKQLTYTELVVRYLLIITFLTTTPEGSIWVYAIWWRLVTWIDTHSAFIYI